MQSLQFDFLEVTSIHLSYFSSLIIILLPREVHEKYPCIAGYGWHGFHQVLPPHLISWTNALRTSKLCGQAICTTNHEGQPRTAGLVECDDTMQKHIDMILQDLKADGTVEIGSEKSR